MLLVLPTQPAADVTSKRGVNAAILKEPRCYLQRSDFGTQGVNIVCGNGRGGGVPKSSDTLVEQFRFDLQNVFLGSCCMRSSRRNETFMKDCNEISVRKKPGTG